MPQLELDGISIHYDQFGSGSDLVWIAGGGVRGDRWHRYHVPYFEADYRNTTYDNRGIGETTCTEPEPWTIADMARDAADLIEALCEPPVAVFGHSMGAMIILQLCLDRPDLLRVAIASGAAAIGSRGWLGDYMGTEVALRRRGGRLDEDFALIHYAAQLYPARILGDDELWRQLESGLRQADFAEDNELSLIPQWQACIDFDVVDRLPEIRTPTHVFVYDQDVQAPPQLGEEVARLVPGAELHVFEGLGHGFIPGRTNEIVNPVIWDVLSRYP
jgi:3-oxoadipate enol-lactonase